MFICSVVKDPPPPVTLSGADVETVATFKLLGGHVSNDVKWTQHMQAVSAKAASRLYFLKQLKRAGAGTEDLLCFYRTIQVPSHCLKALATPVPKFLNLLGFLIIGLYLSHPTSAELQRRSSFGIGCILPYLLINWWISMHLNPLGAQLLPLFILHTRRLKCWSIITTSDV